MRVYHAVEGSGKVKIVPLSKTGQPDLRLPTLESEASHS